MNFDKRVEITSSCRDCDNIPKVKEAGTIIDGDIKYQYMHNGTKILWGTYHSPWMNKIIKNLNGHHEPQEELCFYHILQTLDESANMVELGSHWAYYSLWFNRFVNDSYNLCMEPVPEHIDGGKNNAALNNSKNMEFIDGCFGDSLIENYQFRNFDGRSWSLTMYSLDNLLSKCENRDRNKFFDIVHSDIQGAEDCFTRINQETLDCVGYFVISTHSNPLHNKLISYLQSKDFTILAEHNLSSSYSVDGLIVAINNKHKKKYEKNIEGDIITYFQTNCNISK